MSSQASILFSSNPALARSNWWLTRAHPQVCRIVPVAAVIFFLAWCYVSLRPDFAWDDSDPETLNQARRLARGGDIYRGMDSPPFAFAAYPPLYFAVVSLFLKFTGLSFLPAKLVSFLSALAIGWAMAKLNRQWKNPVWTRSGRDFCFS
jgi:hypothetical protein